MVAESIIEKLVAESYGTKGTDLFLQEQPDKPDNCTTVLDESAPSLDEADQFNIDTAGVQVLIRNTDYATAKANAKTVHQIVSGFHYGKFDANGPWIRATHTVTAPASIGKDKDDRHEWTIHYTFEYESTDNDNRTTI